MWMKVHYIQIVITNYKFSNYTIFDHKMHFENFGKV